MKLPSPRALVPRPATIGRIKRRWRRGITVIAALALGGGGLALLAPATPAFAAAGCSAAYSVQTDWGSGFTAAITVTNSGTTAITGWTLTYSYTGNQTLQSGWDGNWTQSGKTVTVTNASWNGSLAAGATTTGIGANFNYSGTNTAPTSVSCTPAGGTTTPSITATPTTLSVVQGKTGSFTLALSSAPASNETVSIAASGNTGLTAAPTTLTFTPSNFATPQTVTVTANTTGTGTTTFTASGTGYTSATVTATETAATTPSITATPTSLSVVQNGTGTFTLALSAAPSSNETVSIATSGNTGLTASPTTLTFTPSNFATPQTVTVTANATGTGTTMFTASGTGYTSATVTATETVASTPSITATPTTLSVVQGTTGTFTLALSSAPSSSETVTVGATGNTGLTASPTTLTFTPSNFSTPQTVTVTADASSTGATTFTASGTGYTSATVTATETTGSTGSCTGSIVVNPSAVSVAQGSAVPFGVSLSAAPTANVTVSVTATGNTGLAASPTTLTFTSSNWNLPQPVTLTANASGTGTTTFTASSTGCTSASTTGTETTAGSTTTQPHVTNPFTGATWYVNPNYTSEVSAAAVGESGTLAAQMNVVGQQPTFIWLDHIGAIYGGGTNASSSVARMSLQQQLANAASAAGSTPTLFPIVIYDLPNRDCAALASNGELTVSNNGIQYYQQNYINPIAQILTAYEHTSLRVIAVIEPDSLPNLVTNTSDANCAQAQSSGAYTTDIEYALNKLHAIPNVYNYIDIAHSAWLGWSSNMSPAVTLYHTVAAATTAGVNSVDGFISNTANYIPTSEPYMTATENVDGNPVDSVQYYSYDPYIDELTYDEAMYTNLVSAGFPSTIGMLIDTSRNGWGGSARPTGACSTSTCTTTVSFVNASKIDQRPFRGDWCNQEGAGIGAFPQANPVSSFPNLYSYVWVKPPGESDGTYPAFSGSGDPHCDPNGTQTDGSGNTYPTNSFPDSPHAGSFFLAEFVQLVQNADPAIP